MTASAPTIGYGATFSNSTHADFSSPVVWSQVVDINANDPKVSDIDASHLGMATRDKLFIPGLVDQGEVEVEQIDEAVERARVAALRAVAPMYFIIGHPDGTNKIEFAGY